MAMKTQSPKTAGKQVRKNTLVKSLSLSRKIIELGKRRAKAARRSFSNHVSILIEEEAAAAK